MAIDFIRKNKKVILIDDIPETGEANPSETEDTVMENMFLKEALNTLNEGEREVVHLKVVGELTFREIARLLKLPMGTITWRYQNAIKKLRRCGYE